MKGASTTLQIAMEGANGITFRVPEAQQVVKGSFDGKDNPVMQAGQADPVDTKLIHQAMDKLHTALKIDPRNDSAYVDLGFCYGVLRDADSAGDGPSRTESRSTRKISHLAARTRKLPACRS